jgi:hypothetical protein
MGRGARAAVGALVALAIPCGLSAPASAQTSGAETIRGTAVVSSASGSREVVGSTVIAQGVFNGIGRIVETENQPDDPDGTGREDLVFASGTIHVVTTTQQRSFYADPRTCVFHSVERQTSTFDGGTGQFAAATGSATGTTIAWGTLRRELDGSCSGEQAPQHEVDMVTANGSLSY